MSNTYASDFIASVGVESNADREHAAFKSAHNTNMIIMLVFMGLLIGAFLIHFFQSRKAMAAASQMAREAKELEQQRLELAKGVRDDAKLGMIGAAPTATNAPTAAAAKVAPEEKLPELPPMREVAPALTTAATTAAPVDQQPAQAAVTAPSQHIDEVFDDPMFQSSGFDDPMAPKSGAATEDVFALLEQEDNDRP